MSLIISFPYVQPDQPPSLTYAREKYGASGGSPAYYAYVKLTEQYPDLVDGLISEQLQQDVVQLFKKVPNIRAFELAGFDVSEIWKEKEQYREFGERFSRKFTRANLLRNYNRYAKPLFNIISPRTIINHTVSVEEIKRAIEEVSGGCEAFHIHLVHQILQAYDAAPEILACAAPAHEKDKTYYDELYQEYLDDVAQCTFDDKPYSLK